jgi:HPt (histidine-containing phosphotransfer) domain-containing protein
VAHPDAVHVEVPDGLEDIAPAYLEGRRRDVAEATTFLSTGEFDRLRTFGHNLKGSGSSYGFAALSELGGLLEQAARTNDREAAGRQVTAIREYLERVQLTNTR